MAASSSIAARLFALVLLLFASISPAMAQKVFQRADLAADGQRLEERLKREIAASSQPLDALVRNAQAAIGRGDARAALPLANAAIIADPSSSIAWRTMARAAIAIDPKDYRERYELRERATAAAYVAYQRATTRADEATSLGVLGRVFEATENWRPALNAFRLSLDLGPNAALEKDYEALREKYGFRVTSNRVDADAASPRSCFEFSEVLARGRVDFTPYVAISGGRGDFAITAEERELCVDGLRHGERYTMTVRPGVPSSIPGEILTRTSEYVIYVRDRKPAVRFTGKNYVLPRTGQQGIPVVSINAPKIDITVMRVGDRNLINSVHSEEFLAQLGGFDANRIAREKGQRVWQGEMDAQTELNKDVVTAFPVVEAVGKLQPGLYVMTAEPASGKPKPVIQTPAPGDDPDAGDSGDGDWEQKATQWFVVSDLGLTSFSGPDGVHVLVRSLADASPVNGAEIRLIARNNEILATVRTDANGHAKFDAGLGKGQGGMSPGLVTAQAGEDYGFLDLKQAAFDLTDRGVKGRVAPQGLDAFLFTERGVYRSGETVHLTTLLRDGRGQAVAGLPLTLVIKRPDGIEYRRTPVADQGAGGRALSMPLLSNAAPGTWRAQAFSDPKGLPIGEVTFLVEDYVPERIEVALEPVKKVLRAGEPGEIDVTAKYLYGAIGAGLDVTGSTILRSASASAIPGFAGYDTGVTDEAFESVQNDIEGGATTDNAGKARIAAALDAAETNRPLEAEITIRVAESGGRAVARSVTLPIVPKGAAIGVKKLFKDGELGAGQTANFEAIMAFGDGRRIARPGVKWQLSRVSRNYQWFFKEGRWNYETVKSVRRVADGEVAMNATAAARLSAPVDWGSYRLDLRADGTEGAETSIEFVVGYSTDKTADTPDVLETALDKPAYAVGDTMQLRISPRFAGKATIAVISDRVAELKTVDVAQGGTTIPLTVSAEWGASAYVVALAHRPMDQRANRLPGRAIGLAFASFGKAERTIAVNLNAPALVRPLGKLTLPVKLTGLRSGEEAFVTVAAVDIGILNLTRYETPDPVAHFFGQRQLGHELRDLYGYLIDGMQGARGAIRSGGDATASAGIKGDVPVQEPLARYSGVVKVGQDGAATIEFDMPAFNGAVRVMAAAWSAGKVGQASADVIVRDPIVAQATLPRFLALGDRSRFHIEINNVEGPAGAYTVDLDVKGPVLVAADATRRVVTLAAKAKTQVTIPVTAAGIGTASFDVTVTGPNGVSTRQALSLRVQPSLNTIARRNTRTVEPNGGQLTLSSDLLADLVPGSGAVSVSVSPLAALDVPALLGELDRYPYGCTEQTVARAMPLLYVNRLASLESLAMDSTAEARITAAVEKVLARQSANGSFGLWGVGGEDLWLDAMVSDFLTRARERNIPVPPQAFALALDRLRNQLVNAGEIRTEEAAGLAYAAYVLARNGRPVMGDLRYLADNKLGDFATPLAKGQIGAALAMLGDRARARTAFTAALGTLQTIRDDGISRADYGTRLRDGAGLLTLIAETDGERADIQRAAQMVDNARAGTRFTSTQENLWMVLAAQALARDAENLALTVDGTAHKGALYRTIRAEVLEAKPMVIANPGTGPARATVTVSGVPTTPEPAVDQGFTIERGLYTMKGQPADPRALRQNERYVVVLKLKEPAMRYGRLLVVDPLPAGLEIENASITDGASMEGLNWFKQEVEPVNIEARDDRYVAAFTREGNQPAAFAVAYTVRAVSPGRYVHPAAFIEDMYKPDRYGRTAFGAVEILAAR
jgi:alpha-2-macroglobulin